MATFATRLSAAMQEKGMKTADLSRATGISTSLITHWKKGRVECPNGKQLKLVSDALNAWCRYWMPSPRS